MKKLLYTFSILAASWAMTGCSEDTYDGANGQIPNADDINAVITVDQNTNQVTFKLENQGNYPIWRVYKSADKASLSTVNGYTDIITLAGDYTVEVQMGNRNGVCQGSKTYTFHIDKSIVDWTPYMTFLTGGDGSSKRWEMARTMQGHLGCGESGSDGLGWWSAAPDNKAGTGMYETILEFGDNGAAPSGIYKLDPANGGMIYCNKGVTNSPYGEYNPNDDNDYSAPFALRESTFTFDMEGTDLYLTLPKDQTLSYVASNEILDNPRFRVTALTRNKIELISDDGTIAWHYIFVPEGSQATEPEPVFEGYDYNNENNLYLNATPAFREAFTATGDDWAQIENPDVNITKDLYTVTYNTAPGATQWQAQVKVDLPGLETSADKTYDVSMVISCDAGDIPTTTVKLTDGADDNNFLFAETAKVPGYENYVLHLEEVAGIDCSNYMLVLDFAGAPVGNIKVEKITIIDHALNPGPFPPGYGEEEKPSVTWVDENSDDNLWKNCTKEWANWTADDNWGGIADPEAVLSDDNSFTLTYPVAPGTSQWQAQVKINTNLAFSADKAYDFRMVITPQCDIMGATIKLTDKDDDNTYYTADRHDLLGFEDNVFEFVNVTGCDIPNFQFCMDLAGIAANAPIKVSHIIIQEHRD